MSAHHADGLARRHPGRAGVDRPPGRSDTDPALGLSCIPRFTGSKAHVEADIAGMTPPIRDAQAPSRGKPTTPRSARRSSATATAKVPEVAAARPMSDAASLLTALFAVPSPAQVADAAGLYPAGGEARGALWLLRLGPGIVELSYTTRRRKGEPAGRNRIQRENPGRSAGRLDVPSTGQDGGGQTDPEAVAGEPEEADGGTDGAPGWPWRSRRNLVRAVATLDLSPLLAAPSGWPTLVTLTYPAEWERWAPNAWTVKRHLERFRGRLARALGGRVPGLWKLEFQSRGAPHLHLLAPLPATVRGEPVTTWVSRAWSEVVGTWDVDADHMAAGTGLDWSKTGTMADPARLGSYFVRHSTAGEAKAYQHVVPELWRRSGGPGRWWGIWGMRPATTEVALSPDDADVVWRELAARYRARYPDRRADPETGEIRPGAWDNRASGGFLVVPDGPALAAELAGLLAAHRQGLGGRPVPT